MRVEITGYVEPGATDVETVVFIDGHEVGPAVLPFPAGEPPVPQVVWLPDGRADPWLEDLATTPRPPGPDGPLVDIGLWAPPGTHRCTALVLVDRTPVGPVTVDLPVRPPHSVELTLVDPGRGWEGQLTEWRANRDAWAAAASPAVATLIRDHFERGERTRFVTI